MTKTFIDVFECKTPCKIFTGKDALRHATFFLDKGYVCNDANRLYKYFPVMVDGITWRAGNGFKYKQILVGKGIHAKIYRYKDYVILTSQNLVASPLFEFAVVYETKPRLFDFIKKTFKRAQNHQKWWVESGNP